MSGRKEESVSRTPQSSEFETWLKEFARADPPPKQTDLIAIGDRLVEGRFEVTELLGRGGMGSVYNARDHRDQRDVAIKTLRGRRPERLYRLKREFRALADLRHRNLVKLWELHRDGDRWFFTMELVRGVTVTKHLREEPLERVRDVIGQLAAGLAVLHRAGLVHRDVKPSNTIVDENGRVVLLDFGLVADLAAGPHPVGAVLGTVEYMAPEQAEGMEPTAAADLYSLGVILYQVLTGQLPEGPEAPDSIEDDELRTLCRELLGAAPGRPTAAAVARRLGVAAPPIPGQGALIGREGELAALFAHMDKVTVEGVSTVVEVRGDPGIGKTALLTSFCAQARLRGSLVLSGRCREREQVPFNALDSIIDGVVELLREASERGELSTDTTTLARLFPALGAVTGSSDGLRPSPACDTPIEEPSVSRHRAFGGLADMLAEAAGERPLVIAIDDAHWADADSAALLAFLLASKALSLLVVLVTSNPRSAATARLSERLGARVVALDLGPLPTDSAAALAESHGASSELAAKIASAAGGIPLFVQELARLKAPGDRSQLETLLSVQLDQLDETATRVLRFLAIATTALTRELLFDVLRALGIDRHLGVEAFDSLERGRFARTIRRRGLTALEPYHKRVGQAVLADLSDAETRAIHRSLAEGFARITPEDAIARSYHHRQAGDVEQARACALDAARHAHESLAFDRAARLYATAIELGTDPTFELLLAQAEALEGAGRGAQAAAAFARAADSIAETDPAEARSLERRAAEQLLRAGHIDEGIDAISRLLAAEGMPLPRGSLTSLLQLGIERLRLLFNRKRGDGGDLRRLEATWALAVGLSQVDPIRGALYQARHLRLALESGDRTRIALGLCADAFSAAAKGPPATHAHQLIAEAEETGADSTDPRVPAYLNLARAEVGFLSGEFSAAREYARDADESFKACRGARWEQATAKLFYLTCLWHTGRLTKLRSETLAAAKEARALSDRYALTQLQTTVLPPIHLLADQPEKAVADLGEALAAWSRREMFLQHWQHLQATALVDLYQREPAKALAAFESRFVGAGKLILSQVKAVRVFTAYVRGLAAVGALAQRPRDRDYLRAATRDIRRLKREGESADTVALIEAQLHYVLGNEDLAYSALRLGIDAAANKDLQLIAACGRRCLAQRFGDAGAGERSQSYFERHSVARPDRIAAMLMPGFAEARP